MGDMIDVLLTFSKKKRVNTTRTKSAQTIIASRGLLKQRYFLSYKLTLIGRSAHLSYEVVRKSMTLALGITDVPALQLVSKCLDETGFSGTVQQILAFPVMWNLVPSKSSDISVSLGHPRLCNFELCVEFEMIFEEHGGEEM